MSGAGLSPRGMRIAGVALALLLLGTTYPIFNFSVDDAFISFRYSYNLMHGHGLVYNLGERVEGYTNFLWVVLLAPFTLCPWPIEWSAKVISFCACLGSLWTLLSFPRVLKTQGSLGALDALAPAIAALSFPFVLYGSAGLESPLFTFLLLQALLHLEREIQVRQFGRSNIYFLLLSLTRPEGCLFFGLALIYRIIRSPAQLATLRSKSFLNWLAGYALPGLIYFLGRAIYFGAWLPNTFYAKTGDIDQQFNGGLHYFLSYLESIYPLYYLVAALSIFVLLYSKSSRQFFSFIILIIFTHSAYVILIGGDWMKQFRFFHPLIPLWALIFQEGIKLIIARYIDPIRHRGLRTFSVDIILIGVTLALPALLITEFKRASAEIALEHAFWKRSAGRMGTWLSEHGQPNAEIAMGDIGEIGFRTNFRVLDLLGLVTKEISQLEGGYTRKSPHKIVDYIIARKPEYVLLITTKPTIDGRAIPHSDVPLELVKRPSFYPEYATFLDLRVTDWPHYWVILRNIAKTNVNGVVPNFNFEAGTFQDWRGTGAFSSGPKRNSELDKDHAVWGMEGEWSAASDPNRIGALVSAPFKISKPYINFISWSGETSVDLKVELLINTQTTRIAGKMPALIPTKTKWDVRQLIGQEAQIRILDNLSSQSGFIAFDFVRFTDQ